MSELNEEALNKETIVEGNEEKVVETKLEQIEAKTNVSEKKVTPASENAGIDDFDWAAYNEEIPSYGNYSKDQVEVLYDKTLSTIAENEVLEGTVISMNKREVVVNIGYKLSLIHISE